MHSERYVVSINYQDAMGKEKTIVLYYLMTLESHPRNLAPETATQEFEIFLLYSQVTFTFIYLN